MDGPKEKENKHKNLLSFNQTHLIDIPTPYDNLINYKATLGQWFSNYRGNLP